MSSSPIAPSDSSLQGQYAGFVSRLLAILIDLTLVTATLIVVGLALRLVLQFFNLDTFLASAVDNLEQRWGFVDTFIRIATALGSFYFIFYVYYVLLHTSTGGLTIGKSLMGLRVVRMEGTPLTLGRTTRRYLTFLLAALPLFAGLLWVIIDDRRQGWHDKLSSTCVIYDWPAQEDENFLSGMRTRLRYMRESRERYGIGADGDSARETADSAPTADSLT